MDEKLYRVNFEEIVKEMKSIVDDYEKLPQDALRKKEIELLDIEHKVQVATDIAETYKQKMETYQNLQYEEAGDIFNKAKLEYKNSTRNLSIILIQKNDKQDEIDRIKNMIQDYDKLQDNAVKKAKDEKALKDKEIKKRIDSIKAENDKFRKNIDKNINLEIKQIEEKEQKFKLARENANHNAKIHTAEERMVLDNFANEKQSVIDKYNNNVKEYMNNANEEIDKLEKLKKENETALRKFLIVVKNPNKINSLFDNYEKENIEQEETKKAEVTENDTKKEKNTNKENTKGVEKAKKTNSVELDEFLNAKSSDKKPEKENDIKYVDFNEFFSSKKDEKAQEEPKKVELDEESKIIAIAGKNIDGFIKYQYVNEETEKTKETERYDKKSYKEYYNEYRTMGFKNGTVEFDIDTLKNVDPLLLKYLENTKPDLALQVAKKISNHEDLSEFKDLIKYDMTGADKLTRKEKKICRKIAKIARRNGLEVKNIEATKGFWGKLLDKILVRDAGDEFLVAAKETKQLEAGESENKKAMNEFKEQLGQQVKDMLKEENSIDTKKEDEELTAEAEKSIKNAMEARKANIEDLNKDEDENER